jgi:hypothetical protein
MKMEAGQVRDNRLPESTMGQLGLANASAPEWGCGLSDGVPARRPPPEEFPGCF